MGQGMIARTNSSSKYSIGVRVTTDGPCKVLQIKASRLQEVCKKPRKIENYSRDALLQREMLEAPGRQLAHLEPPDYSWLLNNDMRSDAERMSDIKRKGICDALSLLEKVWISASMGATTVPRGTIEIMQPHLGECGQQTYRDVFQPMYTEQSLAEHNEFRAEIYWFCWCSFLSQSADDGTKSSAPRLSEADIQALASPGDPSVLVPSTMGDGAEDDEVDLSIFLEKETVTDKLVSWLLPDHRIGERFLLGNGC